MKQQLNRDGIKYLLTPFCWTTLMAVAFFIAAGRLDIFRAWLTFGIHFLGAIVGAILMCKFAPELANQRASVREGTKTWDKIILTIYFSLILLIIPVIAGLDVGRYGWSRLSAMHAVGGVALYLVFFAVFYWAMLTNRHFEGTSRIQIDRGHKVITAGPYRFIRHPGYVAMILASFADSFMIGSLYSLIPSALAMIATIVRTFLEDKMLQEELEGYPDYATRIKYRLIPGIW